MSHTKIHPAFTKEMESRVAANTITKINDLTGFANRPPLGSEEAVKAFFKVVKIIEIKGTSPAQEKLDQYADLVIMFGWY